MHINVNVPVPPLLHTPQSGSSTYLSPFTPCLTPSSGSSVASSPSPRIQVGRVYNTEKGKEKDWASFQTFQEDHTYPAYPSYDEYNKYNEYHEVRNGGVPVVNPYAYRQQQHLPFVTQRDDFNALPTATHNTAVPPMPSQSNSEGHPNPNYGTGPRVYFSHVPTFRIDNLPSTDDKCDGTPPRKRLRGIEHGSSSSVHSLEPSLSQLPQPMIVPSQSHSPYHPIRLAPSQPPQIVSSQLPPSYASGSDDGAQVRGNGRSGSGSRQRSGTSSNGRKDTGTRGEQSSRTPTRRQRLSIPSSSTTHQFVPSTQSASSTLPFPEANDTPVTPIKFRFVTVHTVNAPPPRATTTRQQRQATKANGQSLKKSLAKSCQGEGSGRMSRIHGNGSGEDQKDVKVEGEEDEQWREGGRGTRGSVGSNVCKSGDAKSDSMGDASHDSGGSAEPPKCVDDNVEESDVANENTNNDLPEFDSVPVLLEEFIDDDDDDTPFEHGPTDLPPRSYSGASSWIWAREAHGAATRSRRRTTTHSGVAGYGFDYSPGPNWNSIGCSNGEFGTGHGRVGHGPPATLVNINGRMRAVGKIPASELEFLPILEARFASLERAIASAIKMRAERAVRNSVLPSRSHLQSQGASKEKREGEKEAAVANHARYANAPTSAAAALAVAGPSKTGPEPRRVERARSKKGDLGGAANLES